MAIIQHLSALKERINMVSKWNHRNIYNDVIDYLRSQDAVHVYVLRGLRRTGKTTIALQALISDEAKKLGKAAIMQVEDGDRISLLKKDIKELYDDGVRVLLIDEATKAVDFTNGSAILPDIFSGMGMKIILTGTDSLKFYFANGNGLFDRVYEGRTTYIPFNEWMRIIKLGDLDTYIEYGGTLCHEYTNKNKVDCFSFANSVKTYEYTDSAIAQNIQHSLETESGRRSFHELYKLYSDGLLTGIINRIVERENHYMILETVQRKFFPKDLEDGINNIAKDTWRNIPDETFNKIDIEKLINNLMKSLSITNDKILREVTEEQMQRLKKYLYDLDLFVPDKTYVISPQYNSSPTCVEDKDCNICVQPGMRYNHAKTLVEILDYDTFIQSGNLSHRQKNELYTMFLNMSKGRILEEIIRNETREFLEKNQNYDVYKVEFNNNDSTPCGEYDMLIYNKNNNSCQIYEIKHNKHKSKRQGHWLRSTSLNYLTEYFFGKITKRAIIYMGDNDVGEKQYINANDYLQNIKDYIF